MKQLLALILLAASSCAAQAQPPAPSFAQSPPSPPLGANALAPTSSLTPVSPAPYSTPVPLASDTCGLTALNGLVGRPRSEIPIPTDLSRRRVVCSTCPISQDYRPDRVTIVYDRQTGRVTRLQCG